MAPHDNLYDCDDLDRICPDTGRVCEGSLCDYYGCARKNADPIFESGVYSPAEPPSEG